MARFRRRRRFLHSRRYRRPRRRLRSKRRYRLLRRSRRGRKSFTVRQVFEHPLQLSSRVPHALPAVAGSTPGVRPTSFVTWNINPLPLSLEVLPPLPDVNGTWTNTAPTEVGSLYSRTIGSEGGNLYQKALTDFPLLLSRTTLFSSINCKNLQKMCKWYRVSYVTMTFTVPENVNEGHNHHLYLEWTHLPKASTCQMPDCVGSALPLSSVNGLDTYGWNNLCRPQDILEATCVEGKESGLHGWQRKQLSYATPVTISFRPRHAKLPSDSLHYVATTWNGNANVTDQAAIDVFSKSYKLSRGYRLCRDIPTTYNPGNNDMEQYWFGPIIRLVDADTPSIKVKTATPPKDPSLFDLYGIRVTMEVKLKFAGFLSNDPLFPSYYNN
nr:MAG: capsid protein [ssDNA virus sp.]